jgi:hypothetical protein
MRPLRDIKRLVGRAEIHSRPEANRAVLDDLLRELAASTQETGSRAKPSRWNEVARSSVARVAVAAGIVIAALLGIGRLWREPRPTVPEGARVSAAEMLTVGRLNAAYRHGGLPELQRHCETAAQRLGLPPGETTPIDRFLQD